MILITGGAGYIGSHTVADLVSRGKKVIVLDNMYSGHKWALPKGVELVIGSVLDKPLVEQLLKTHRVESVMHFAAHLDVGESVRLPQKYYENNQLGSFQLISACIAQKVKNFIFSSSCSVYGTPAKNPVDETAPLNPESPYGRSKVATEWLLKDLEISGSSLKYVSLRYFNVAGGRMDGTLGQSTEGATQLVKAACEVAIGKRTKLLIHGSDYPTKDGTCVRDYIHVDDLAAAHLDALAFLENGGASDVFNCGYGTGYTVKEVVEMVKRVSGVSFTVEMGPRRPGDPVAAVADPKKIVTTLHWKPRFNSLETICQTAWNWEKTLKQKRPA